MSQLQALADVLDETAALNGLAPRHNGFHLEPRCRVCRNDDAAAARSTICWRAVLATR